jgi:hypothetical protein
MSRKTVLWIIAGVLAAAVVAAVGIVSYHVGFNHGAGGGVANLRGPMMRGNPFGIVVARRDGAVPGFGLFLALLAAGGIGALIVYLVDQSRRPARASVSGPNAAPGGGAYDPRWQQLEEWHRYVHNPAAPGWAGGPAGPAGPAAAGASGVPAATADVTAPDVPTSQTVPPDVPTAPAESQTAPPEAPAAPTS